MTRFAIKICLLLSLINLVSIPWIKAQITPSKSYSLETIEGDSVYIFCATRSNVSQGSLTATPPMGVSSTFTWEKYDTLTANYIPYTFVSYEDTLRSTISSLENGLYRVTINSGGNIVSYQSWVLNNWLEVTKAEIPDSSSTCDGFQIRADFEYAPLVYYDKQNKPHNFRDILAYGEFTKKWYKGSEWIFSSLEPFVFPPEASPDPIEYRLTIKDYFGCETSKSVEYISKVPLSVFTVDPMKGEAVLKVTFTNNSVNYDSTLWHFYKSTLQIQNEIAENKDEPVDSIDFILYDEAPIYEYERSGTYLVKLVTIKVNPTTGNCYDTLHMETGIEVDTSLVKAPNVFTPNGDGRNDLFVVRSQSLKSMTIKIYNRWGGLVHSWSYSNIRGRDYTYEHSVWDGRIGGQMASPGVYFYVIRAVGRDGEKRNKEGFVHLFRDKN